jgi:hypothetical protein
MKPVHKVIIAGIMISIAILFINGYFDGKNKLKELKSGIKNEGDTTTHWHDLYNTEHATNVSLHEDLQTAKVLHEKELSEAATRLGLKDRQIQNLNKFVATLQGSFTATIDTKRRGDTTASTVHIDPFSTFSTFTIGDRETVNYKIRVPIHLTQYWKRPHSFIGVRYGVPINYIDGYSTNKNVTIDSMTNVRILAKVPGRWGAGPYIGLGTTGVGFTWSVGVSVHYSIIRW